MIHVKHVRNTGETFELSIGYELVQPNGMPIRVYDTWDDAATDVEHTHYGATIRVAHLWRRVAS